jgi:hypothetical protein
MWLPSKIKLSQRARICNDVGENVVCKTEGSQITSAESGEKHTEADSC